MFGLQNQINTGFTFQNSFYPVSQPEIPIKRTLDPIVTGTSVIGIKYNGGVMLAADTLASYGSLARYKDFERVRTVSKKTLIGGSGDLSDFQYIITLLEELIDEDNAYEDGSHLTTSEIFNYLTRVLYNRRNSFDPLWNQIVICGVKDEKFRSQKSKEEKPKDDESKFFLGQVDLHGTFFEDNTIATGYGAYIARPLLRQAYKPDLSEKEARDILERCMRVLYYRDARAINRIQIGKVTATETVISEPFELETEWCFAEKSYGYPKPK